MAWEGEGTCCQGREGLGSTLAPLTYGSSLSFRPIYTVHTYRRVSLFPSLVETWEATDEGRRCVVVVSPLGVGSIRFVSQPVYRSMLCDRVQVNVQCHDSFQSVGRSIHLVWSYTRSMPDIFALFGFITHVITYTHTYNRSTARRGGVRKEAALLVAPREGAGRLVRKKAHAVYSGAGGIPHLLLYRA